MGKFKGPSRRQVCTWLSLSLLFAGLGGCGGEPAGDDAYGQKFEKPAGAPEGTGSMPDSGSERREDIKKAQEAAAKKAAAKAASKK